MGEVTGRPLRSVGYAEPWLLETTEGVAPYPITKNADGAYTLTFPDEVPAETLALVKERMETADDDEMMQRRAIRVALEGLLAQPPSDGSLAWLAERAELQDALLYPLAALFGVHLE